MGSEHASRLCDLVSEGPDWPYLIPTARHHGVMPLLYQNLTAVCPDLVPPDVLSELKGHFLANAQSNLFLTGELLKLLDAFGAAGIRAMPVKGPVLAETAYGNLALRQFSDLDLMLDRKNIIRAGELLMRDQFTRAERLDPAQEAFSLKLAYEFGFTHPAKDLLVELHWDVLPQWFSVASDADGIWSRVRAVSLAGRKVISACPEDTLFMLCLHGAKHAWQSLGWICDVSQFIQRHEDLNWDWLLTNARRLKSERLLLLGLHLAQVLLDADLPEHVQRRIRFDAVTCSLAGRVQTKLFGAPLADAPGLEVGYLDLRTQEGMWNKVVCLFRLALTPGVLDIASIRLPQALFALYYLVRPIRLVSKYGLGPFR